jgi:thioredoxin-dependent peroxiredoxin
MISRSSVLRASFKAAAVGLWRIVFGHDRSPRVMLSAGDPAPDFRMVGSDGREYQLADFLDRRQAVVLAWFPKAFTGGCTAECKSLGASAAELARFNVRYVAASVDRPAENSRFARDLGVSYLILSDPVGKAAKDYGVIGASGFATRWTFYIGADGRILDVDRHVRPGTHGSDIVARLAELGVPRHDSARSIPNDSPPQAP